jgi:hypothetical protein
VPSCIVATTCSASSSDQGLAGQARYCSRPCQHRHVLNIWTNFSGVSTLHAEGKNELIIHSRYYGYIEGLAKPTPGGDQQRSSRDRPCLATLQLVHCLMPVAPWLYDRGHWAPKYWETRSKNASSEQYMTRTGQCHTTWTRIQR